MKEIIIDGEKIETKSQVNEIFVKELGFPEYCGNNLDSIAECLDELKTAVTINYRNLNLEDLQRYFHKCLNSRLNITTK